MFDSRGNQLRLECGCGDTSRTVTGGRGTLRSPHSARGSAGTPGWDGSTGAATQPPCSAVPAARSGFVPSQSSTSARRESCPAGSPVALAGSARQPGRPSRPSAAPQPAGPPFPPLRTAAMPGRPALTAGPAVPRLDQFCR